MNKKRILIILGVVLGVLALAIGSYFYLLYPVNTSDEVVTFTVNRGDGKQKVVENLKSANLIRSKSVALIYIVLSKSNNLQAGEYEFSRNMRTDDIIDAIAHGNIIEQKKPTVRLLFVEGTTLKTMIKDLADATDLDYDKAIKEINSKEFLEPLIKDYWFLTEDILDEKIYYPLEGYLFPETYEFYKDTTLNQAVRKMLSITEKKLNSIKDDLEDSKYSIHEIMTIASIVEKEVKTYEERTEAVQVINKRIELNMSLGMDATTYYGVGKETGNGNSITKSDLDNSNPYNTRLVTFLGLPVGPICNPGIKSIEAALNPADTDYLYFISDKNGVTHFAKDFDEFKELRKIYG